MSLSLNAPLQFEEFELDPARRTVERDGIVVPLSPKAFDVLSYLVQNPARVITKDELLKAVWPGAFVEEGNLAQHISSLRKAFGNRAGLIVTIPGRGYQFTARVQMPPAPGAPGHADGTTSLEALEAGQGDGFANVAGQAVAGQTGAGQNVPDVLIQRVRERTRLVIEETAVPFRQERALVPRWALWTLAALLPAAACIGYVVHRLKPPPRLQRVMIADFLNTTGDPAFDRSLNTALAAGLGQSPYIQLMSTGEVHSTLAQMEKALDTPMLGDTALEVCRRAGFLALLRGQIATEGNGYLLTLDVVSCATGAVLSRSSGKTNVKGKVLDTLDSVANGARRQLGETRESIDRFDVPVREATTFSFEALQNFSKGVELGNAGKISECLPYFRKAVDLDPKFAVAVADLGLAYYVLGDGEQAGLYGKQAFDLSGNVTDSEKLFIRANYYLLFIRDLNAARAIREEQTRLYPGDHGAYASLANVSWQLGDAAGALGAAERAVQIANPRETVDYEELALAYQHANRLAEAKRAIAEAQAQHLDSHGLHETAFAIAMVEHDRQVIEREIAWGRDKPQLSRMIEYQAIYEADEGHFKASEDLFRSAIGQAAKDVDANYARAMRLDEAGMELQAGRVREANDLLHQNEPDNSANFATFAARAGNVELAQRYLREEMMYPQETVALFLYRPEMNALIALHRGDPAAAITALDVSRPYELVHPEVIEVRGDAYLALKDGPHAQMEFQKLLANPAVEDPPLPRSFIAHVGLARAYGLEHRTADAKAEYEKFFALWSDADPGIPILEQARAEYARL